MKTLDDLKNITDANLDKLDISEESKNRLRYEVKIVNKINYKRLGFWGVPAVAAIVACIMLFTSIFPSGGTITVYAGDLMKGITAQKVESVELNEELIQSTADFSIELFKHAYSKDGNSLVSPTSVYLALGMTANGAAGNTLKEFEILLGKRDINVKDLNLYYNSLAKKLTNSKNGKVNIANSIWYSNDKPLYVKKDFLQINADYYNASAYAADFKSEQTVKDINNWVKTNTGNLIDKIIDEINYNTIMYLINTVYFENQWENAYKKEEIKKDTFKLVNGTKLLTNFMFSKEYTYLKDDKAEGFIKPYKDGKYSFVALLPNEGVSIDNYVASLSGESFMRIIKNKSKTSVRAAIPKFKSEYNINLVNPLKEMGLKDCFVYGKANFTKMANNPKGEIYVDNILHKTFITVDELGTKAGAISSVEMTLESSPLIAHSIILNRPFVYAIVDNETNLPLFLGTMMKPEI